MKDVQLFNRRDCEEGHSTGCVPALPLYDLPPANDPFAPMMQLGVTLLLLSADPPCPSLPVILGSGTSKPPRLTTYLSHVNACLCVHPRMCAIILSVDYRIDRVSHSKRGRCLT